MLVSLHGCPKKPSKKVCPLPREWRAASLPLGSTHPCANGQQQAMLTPTKDSARHFALFPAQNRPKRGILLGAQKVWHSCQKWLSSVSTHPLPAALHLIPSPFSFCDCKKWENNPIGQGLGSYRQTRTPSFSLGCNLQMNCPRKNSLYPTTMDGWLWTCWNELPAQNIPRGHF